MTSPIHRLLKPASTLELSLDNILACMLAIAIAIPAFLNAEQSFKPFFYFLVIIPTAIAILMDKPKRQEIWTTFGGVFLIAVPIFYWTATTLWSDDPEKFMQTLRRSSMLLVFTLEVSYIASRAGQKLARYLDISLLLVVLGALIHMVNFYFVRPIDPISRLGDGTVLKQAAHASHYFGFFAVYALVRCYQQAEPRSLAFFGIAAFICSLFVVLTETRGALLSILFVWLFVSCYWYKRYLYTGIISALALVAAYAMSNVFLERGLSFRPEIWHEAILFVRGNFWFGSGLGTVVDLPYGDRLLSPHAHNLYLDLQMRTGVFGLLLFVPLCVYILRRAIFAKQEEQIFIATLLFFLLCMLTDVHKLIHYPSPVYVIFWFPLAALIARNMKGRGDTVSK